MTQFVTGFYKRICEFVSHVYLLGLCFRPRRGAALVLSVRLFCTVLLCRIPGISGSRIRLCFRETFFWFHVRNRMDIEALYELFVKKEYDFPYASDPQVIIDAGANIGTTALFFHILFPSARIYAIEPNPSIFTRLVENTKQFSEITCVHAALAGHTGTVDLHIGKSHLGSSIKERKNNTEMVTVPSFTLADFFVKYAIQTVDIMKFDIEGAEDELLPQIQSPLFVKELVGEFHADLSRTPLVDLLKYIQARHTETVTISPDRCVVYIETQ